MNSIFGIGVDLVDVNKFKKKSYSENSSFYNKLFLPTEIKYCLKFKKPAEHFAGKFAIKESVKKSISESIPFLDIETFHSKSKLKIKLHKNWNTKYNILGSISHENEYAIGMVISEKIKN